MEVLTRRARLKRLLGAWGIALGAIAVPIPPAAVFLPFFPVGLVELGRRSGACCDGVVWPYVVLGWMVYVSVSIALYVIDDKRMFFKFFVLLCVLLGLNVVGCHLAVSATGGA